MELCEIVATHRGARLPTAMKLSNEALNEMLGNEVQVLPSELLSLQPLIPITGSKSGGINSG